MSKYRIKLKAKDSLKNKCCDYRDEYDNDRCDEYFTVVLKNMTKQDAILYSKSYGLMYRPARVGGYQLAGSEEEIRDMLDDYVGRYKEIGEIMDEGIWIPDWSIDGFIDPYNKVKDSKKVEDKDDPMYYGLWQKGGSIGQTGYRRYGDGILLKVYLDKEEAKEDAKRYRKSLTPGEKSYYGMGYTVKPLLKSDLKNEEVQEMINELGKDVKDKKAKTKDSDPYHEVAQYELTFEDGHKETDTIPMYVKQGYTDEEILDYFQYYHDEDKIVKIKQIGWARVGDSKEIPLGYGVYKAGDKIKNSKTGKIGTILGRAYCSGSNDSVILVQYEGDSKPTRINITNYLQTQSPRYFIIGDSKKKSKDYSEIYDKVKNETIKVYKIYEYVNEICSDNCSCFPKKLTLAIIIKNNLCFIGDSNSQGGYYFANDNYAVHLINNKNSSVSNYLEIPIKDILKNAEYKEMLFSEYFKNCDIKGKNSWWFKKLLRLMNGELTKLYDSKKIKDEVENEVSEANKEALAEYTQWEGIIGYDEDIIECYESGTAWVDDDYINYEDSYDALDAYLVWEGILGYTDAIYDILKHGEDSIYYDDMIKEKLSYED